MRRLLSLFAVLVVVVFSSGCATAVYSEVTVFHKLPSEPTSTKYAFLPLKGQESLEYSSYQTLVVAELAKYHFQQVSFEEAEVVVVFDYGTGSRQRVGAVPVFGQTGVSSATTYGSVNSYGGMGTYTGTTSYTPTYGITGSMPYSYTEYSRNLWLAIAEKKPPQGDKVNLLYEANLVSEGRNKQLPAVMPYMIRALFKTFPGKSGTTREERIPLN